LRRINGTTKRKRQKTYVFTLLFAVAQHATLLSCPQSSGARTR
jgi:hypothetical protein